jgi:hypothetical protein
MGGGSSNILVAAPGVLVLFGLFVPIALLDGSAAYLGFLWRNPTLVMVSLAAWWVVAYWCTRRLASVLFLRASGAKLRVDDGTPS